MSGGFISLPVPRTRLPYIVYRAQICHNNTLQVFSSSNGSLSYRVENYNLKEEFKTTQITQIPRLKETENWIIKFLQTYR